MALPFFKKKQDLFDYEAARVCKCCSNEFQGRFCNRCGEKVTEPYERSIIGFFDSILNALTALDGKVIKSTVLILTRPGQLSRNIADGNRVPFMKMVSFFFVANFFYFLFPGMDSFNSNLYSQMHWQVYSRNASEVVNERLVRESITLEEFTPEYEAQSTNLAKLLIVILAMMFAGLLSLINFSRKVYFFDHLLLSLEFYTFSLLVVLVAAPHFYAFLIKIVALVDWDWRFLFNDNVITPLSVAFMSYFLIRAQKNFYGQKWLWGVLRTIALIYLLYYTVVIYRAILFYVTMWTV